MITVLVSASTHPVSGRPVRSRNDALAVAIALTLTVDIELLSIGAMPDAVARDYLALGAPSIEIVDAARGSMLPLLARRLADRPLVLTGMRSGDGLGTGMLPYALASASARPMIGEVVGLTAHDGAPAWTVTQALPKGARRQLRVTGPAVLAVSSTAPQTLRHAHASSRSGRVIRSTAASGSASAPAADAVTTSHLVPRTRHLPALEATSRGSGHARMQAAVDSTASSAAGVLLAEGTPHAKAQAILSYLRTHALISV